MGSIKKVLKKVARVSVGIATGGISEIAMAGKKKFEDMTPDMPDYEAMRLKDEEAKAAGRHWEEKFAERQKADAEEAANIKSTSERKARNKIKASSEKRSRRLRSQGQTVFTSKRGVAGMSGLKTKLGE